jgi:radical SAM protein with 4Fe4S-binding SPASM domain
MQSVHEFLTAAKQQQGRTLSVGLNVVLSKGNLKQIGDIIRLAAKLGFDGVYILQPIPVDDISAALCPSPAELSTVRQEDLLELAGGLGLKILFSLQRGTSLLNFMPRCTQPWEYVFIRANGDVAPCCALFGSDKGAIMGNIFQQEFNAIWRGEPFREYRRTSASGTNARCRVCPYH